MNDPYLYEGSSVLRNLLNIHEEKELNLAEAELSRANMMLLYDYGFDDFSTQGIKSIHKVLFEDVYAWAGEFRTINIQKREPLLAGISVSYTDWDKIKRDLDVAWEAINRIPWKKLSREEFAAQLARKFPPLWQIHPFREGNTRTIVMLMIFFVEHYGYYFDKDLLAVSAGYVRNAFVMASLGQYSEFEHFEKILLDAICTEPIEYTDDLDQEESLPQGEKYQKYQMKDYKPIAHEYRADDGETK
ncbi:MAG: Fic family protein [Clostridia bacterium]|nr:Fic family protein [Clostridia bacterium]